MKNVDQNTITQAVLARMGEMPDARLKTILTSLVHHLHDFARDVKLSEEEWMHAIQFLTRTGQKCDDKRQEFILLSDVLGLSMLTVAMNNQKPPGCTEATVFGPFFVEDAPEVPLGGDDRYQCHNQQNPCVGVTTLHRKLFFNDGIHSQP